MKQPGCFALVLIVAALTGVVALFSTPQGAIIGGAVVAAIIIWVLIARSNKRKARFAGFRELAAGLRRFEVGFEPIAGSWLNTEQGETVFCQLEDIQLGEYKSSGSDFVSGYAGANYKLTKNLSVSGGGISGGSTKRPEQLTLIDTGRVAFSDRRVVFVGQKHSREWMLADVLDLDISNSGFQVGVYSRGRDKVSTLSISDITGITPGIAFSVAETLFKEGEAAASSYSAGIAKDVEDQLVALGKTLEQ